MRKHVSFVIQESSTKNFQIQIQTSLCSESISVGVLFYFFIYFLFIYLFSQSNANQYLQIQIQGIGYHWAQHLLSSKFKWQPEVWAWCFSYGLRRSSHRNPKIPDPFSLKNRHFCCRCRWNVKSPCKTQVLSV